MLHAQVRTVVPDMPPLPQFASRQESALGETGASQQQTTSAANSFPMQTIDTLQHLPASPFPFSYSGILPSHQFSQESDLSQNFAKCILGEWQSDTDKDETVTKSNCTPLDNKRTETLPPSSSSSGESDATGSNSDKKSVCGHRSTNSDEESDSGYSLAR